MIPTENIKAKDVRLGDILVMGGGSVLHVENITRTKTPCSDDIFLECRDEVRIEWRAFDPNNEIRRMVRHG